MSAKLYVQAMNVHQGGGLALLLPLLKSIPSELSVVAFIDQRIAHELKLSSNIEIRAVKPTVVARLSAEYWLFKQVKTADRVLCFGNLPPLFPLKGEVLVFLQNRYLVDSISLEGFPLKTRLRLSAERFWLTACAHHVNQFIVQTASMKRLLCSKLACDEAVAHIWPFTLLTSKQSPTDQEKPVNKVEPVKHFSFIYAASGDPHKNHRRLIEAWVLLAEEDLRFHLCVTVDHGRHSDLCKQMEEYAKQYQLNFINVGFLSHADLLEKYQSFDALIYPSLMESYGLPLIEAQQRGLKIIAAELDYVRDVANPEETFDPASAISIARAVKRFMGLAVDQPLLLDASDFLKLVLCTGEKPIIGNVESGTEFSKIVVPKTEF